MVIKRAVRDKNQPSLNSKNDLLKTQQENNWILRTHYTFQLYLILTRFLRNLLTTIPLKRTYPPSRRCATVLSMTSKCQRCTSRQSMSGRSNTNATSKAFLLLDRWAAGRVKIDLALKEEWVTPLWLEEIKTRVITRLSVFCEAVHLWLEHL